MRFLGKIFFAILGNLAGLFAAAELVPGFYLTGPFTRTLLLALALTLLNALLRPILKLFLGPIIVLTLGIGTILVNAVLLKLLDFLAPALTIQGVEPLLWSTLVLAIANFIIHIIIRI